MSLKSNFKEKSFLSQSLKSLNKLSETNSYTVDDIDWSHSVDRSKFWAPENLISVSHLPSYKNMSHELKLLWNQLNAVGIAENFMFFEEFSLVPSMTAALKKTNEPELKKAIQNFIDEEIKHALCFKKLILKSMPELYNESNFKFQFIKMSPIVKICYGFLKKYPHFISAWTWLAIFFEERTLMFSKEYIQSHKKDKNQIDELFYQTHYYHMLDEVRHVKMDEYFIRDFYKPFGSIDAQIGAWVVKKVLQRVTYPLSMTKSCITHIKKIAPHLLSKDLENQILHELKSLAKSDTFLQQNLSTEAAPRTQQLMETYPEFSSFWQDLVKT